MSEDRTTYSTGGFRFNEKYLSQIPALQLLINLGYEYVPPEQVYALRKGSTGNVILEEVLEAQLKEINRIHHKGREYRFSEENIQTALQKLKNVKFDGLQKTNEKIFDLLTLGTSLEQSIEGDARSFNLYYINWTNPSKNKFHVTAEFSVDRTRSDKKRRPDIVLFVNGIPLVVMECKSPEIEVKEAIKQSIRNEREDNIPKLFAYAQVVMGINKNEATYGTAGTAEKYWAHWQEREKVDERLARMVNQPLSRESKGSLFSGDFAPARKFFHSLAQEGGRQVTKQDRAIYSLCRPERLIELACHFTLFDGGNKKIARYQQYFAVRRIMKRVKEFDEAGIRRGGILWHTQGSGKSLTMVWLARALVMDRSIINPRILLVTDRVDLDEQLGNTFASCGLDKKRAKTGRHLLELVCEKKASIITTLVHKFDKALNVRKHVEDSAEIFILVDEAHRTQFKGLHSRMRQMFPRACYIGFTGTPLMKKEKNNFVKFGGLIDAYPIDEAVKDGAVVPLLYEGRHVEMEQNKKAIDLWFERHTQGLTKEQKGDLKKKYARANMLSKAEQVVYMRAFDISEHFRSNWQGTGLKAQLVAPLKVTALKYKEYLDHIGYVKSKVIISPPGKSEGDEKVDDEPEDKVQKFWTKMLKRYISEEAYNKEITERFKYEEEPEILIVVDKLLTGFDAPRNTVLYLCRTLRGHTLLQAIARVNRLYEDELTGEPKDYGYIVDYEGVLGELDNALTSYKELSGFDEEDIKGALRSIDEEVKKLPQRHSDLWDIFRGVENEHDEEAYELMLGDEILRHDFYERLSDYSFTLGIALSSEQFVMSVSDAKLKQYKNDLKHFQKMRTSVKLRYAETIDYRRHYEPKLKKLLDTHIFASEVYQLNDPVNIFDEDTFLKVKQEQGIYETKTKAARADAIAHATKKAIAEHMGEDPAFFTKFSKLIQQAIDDFRAKRISDLEYLNRAIDIRGKVVRREHDDMPEAIGDDHEAMAFFGIIKPFFDGKGIDAKRCENIASDTALAIRHIVKRNWKVNFIDDFDAQKQTMNEIDDYLYDEVRDGAGIDLTMEEMDAIIEDSLKLAKNRNRQS
ncbi:MAG: HsdR family type I site-specific deoxyribonuclease [Deltaproteobacteria bacterium]|nr:HsdR family type I site-specific deoxyribonuclease [Deltaproteobacteria bacterium]